MPHGLRSLSTALALTLHHVAAHLSHSDKSMSELSRVLRGDSVDGDRFGRAVALGPDLALVGADSAPCGHPLPGGECNLPGTGAVYVFGRDWVDESTGSFSEAGYRAGSRWWGLRKKLVPPDGVNGQRFGASVALDPVMHVAVVAAPVRPVLGKNESGQCATEGHVCQCFGEVRFGHAATDSWAPPLTVKGSVLCVQEIFDDPAPGRVKVCDCTASQERLTKNASGAVYVYQQDHGGIDTWGLVNVLTLASTAYADTYGIQGREYFGSSVSVSGRHLVVGCPRCHGRNVREAAAGVVFLYHCVSLHTVTSQCQDWQVLKELVPEPEHTQAPTFCAAQVLNAQNQYVQADWTCHRQNDHFGNSVAVMGCCNSAGQMLVADGKSGRPLSSANHSDRRGYRALCDMSVPCKEVRSCVRVCVSVSARVLSRSHISHS